MNIIERQWALPVIMAVMLLGLMPVRTALAADGFVSLTSSSGYDETVARVRKLVARNGMMVLGEINQGKVMTRMTGMHLKAVSLFVGNPNVGKKLFTTDAGVGIVLPVRINIYESHGRTHVNYFKPSSQLASFDNPKLVKMGHMLDGKLDKMTGMLR